jgi:Ca2+-binding RTX toxin-like protein
MAQVFETANNNTIATATNLGNIRNSPFVKGDLFGSDSADFFKFQVDRPIRGGIGLVPQGIDANLVVFNSNGQQIRNSLKPGTATEGISFDNLPTGEYKLLVSKASGSGSYTLSANGVAIAAPNLVTAPNPVTAPTLARLTVNVKEISNNFKTGGFDLVFVERGEDKADFYTKVKINGKTQTSRTVKDTDKVTEARLNFNPFGFVDPTLTRIPLRIDVFDDDPFSPDDKGDINSEKGILGLEMLYDTLTGELISTTSGRVVGREGEITLTQGNGDAPSANVKFIVNYDTFVSSNAFSNSTPLIRGTNASQDLTGQNQGGILCGEGGNDKLSGMGGNDALCGGTGNDIQIGGTGNDISFGGLGRDIHTGGTGNDTFVLTLNNGVDVVKDFQNGKDKLGLAIELNPEILDIVQQGKNVVVGVGDQRLAVLSNVKANQITAADFVTVDFTHFKGIEVPTLVA